MVKWNYLLLVLCISASLVIAQEQSDTELINRFESSVPGDTQQVQSAGRASVEHMSTDTVQESLGILNAVATLMGVLVALITLIIAAGGIFGIFEYKRIKDIRKQIIGEATKARDIVVKAAEEIKPVIENLKRLYEEMTEMRKTITLPPLTEEPSEKIKATLEEYGRRLNILEAFGIELTFEDYLNRGVDFFYKNNFELALKAFEKVIQLKPDRADAWFNRGTTLSKLGHYEDALEAYDKAIQLKPDDPDAWVNKGSILSKLDHHEDALKAYDEAIQLKPDHAEAWFNKGCALDKLGRHEDAIKAYDKAIQLKPDHANAWVNRGSALSELNRHDEAIKAYDKAIQLKPDHTFAWVNKGCSLGKLGRYKDALEVYAKAIQLKPDDADAWYNRACLHACKGHKTEAFSDLRRALEIEPSYKEYAKKDEDFKDYRDDVEFKEIVS